MTRSLRVLPEAEQELQEAALWYESKRAGLGVDLVAAVDEATDRILEAPLAHAIWLKGLRYGKLALRRFPFVIFFIAEETQVDVVAAAHAKRRPGYWIGRVAEH